MKVIIVNFMLVCCLSAVAQTKPQADWQPVIKNKQLYANSFLSYFNYVQPESLYISADSIVVANDVNGAIIIPTDLPLNQTIRYTGKQQEKTYMLLVMRINYTNVWYTLIDETNGERVYETDGVTTLSPSFYLGVAGVYEDTANETFGMNEYYDNDSGAKSVKLLIPQGTTNFIQYSETRNGNSFFIHFEKLAW